MNRLAATRRGIRGALSDSATFGFLILSVLIGAAAGAGVALLFRWADDAGTEVTVWLLVVVGLFLALRGLRQWQVGSGPASAVDRRRMRGLVRIGGGLPSVDLPDVHRLAVLARRSEMRVLLGLLVGLVPFTVAFAAVSIGAGSFPRFGVGLLVALLGILASCLLRLGAVQQVLESTAPLEFTAA